MIIGLFLSLNLFLLAYFSKVRITPKGYQGADHGLMVSNPCSRGDKCPLYDRLHTAHANVNAYTDKNPHLYSNDITHIF